MNPQERRGNCRMSMVMDRSTSIEEFPEIKSGEKDVSTPLLRLHVVVSYVMALLRPAATPVAPSSRGRCAKHWPRTRRTVSSTICRYRVLTAVSVRATSPCAHRASTTCVSRTSSQIRPPRWCRCCACTWLMSSATQRRIPGRTVCARNAPSTHRHRICC